MARQMTLMGALAAAPDPGAVLATTPRRKPRTDEERSARLEEERQATDAAFVHLQEGLLDDALAELLPHASDAQDTRTLTTIARIRGAQGQFDEAFNLFQRAERLDPADPKVLVFTADLLKIRGRHVEELQYRRRAAFTNAEAPTEVFVNLIAAIGKAAPRGKPPPISEIRIALDRIQRADDLPPEKMVDVAKSIYGIKALASEATALYLSASPCAAHERDVTATWTTLAQWCKSRNAPLHAVAAFGAPGRRPLLAELKDAIVHPGMQWMPLLDDGTAILSGFASRRIRLRSEDVASPLLMAGVKTAVLRLPKEVPVVDGPAILLGGNGTYHHDLVEYVGSLAIAEKLRIGQDAKLIVNEKLAPHQKELFELLGIGPERLLHVPVGAPMRFRHLLLPSRLSAGGRWFDSLLPAWYRERLAPLRLHGPAPSRRLYLSRTDTTRRRIDNEAEVMAELSALGFESVRPETLSLKDQIALFSQASHIVGSSGAALATMLFTPPRARIVVLQNEHLVEGGGDLYFDALATACDHAMATLPCRPTRLVNNQRAIDADLFVDIGQLRGSIARVEG